MDNALQQIAERIKRAKNVLICTHIRPDGDAYGSAFALGCALEYLHIPYRICVESNVPSNLRFLEGVDKIQRTPQEGYDLLVTVDCSDEQRLGVLSDYVATAKRKRIDVVNVDHHISNTRYGTYNYVRTCAANCMNMAMLLQALGTPLDKRTAEYLLVGVLTDSGNFSHDDVTEETMSLTAELLKVGADIRYYNERLFKCQPKQRIALHAAVMSKIRYYFDGCFAAVVISKAQMQDCEADEGMTEGFVDFPLSVDTVEVAASLLEVKKGQYKISLRSKTYADVNRIAGVYGGGGHVRAAGCMLFGDVEEVLDKLSYTVSQYLE